MKNAFGVEHVSKAYKPSKKDKTVWMRSQMPDTSKDEYGDRHFRFAADKNGRLTSARDMKTSKFFDIERKAVHDLAFSNDSKKRIKQEPGIRRAKNRFSRYYVEEGTYSGPPELHHPKDRPRPAPLKIKKIPLHRIPGVRPAAAVAASGVIGSGMVLRQKKLKRKRKS
jgi:hypothetical protein